MKMSDNFVGLTSYIKNQYIKEKFNSHHIVINNMGDVEYYANKVSLGLIGNFIFENSQLKNAFFSIIKTNMPNITIINCNSSYKRILDTLEEARGLIVYDNVHKCQNIELINNNCILVC